MSKTITTIDIVGLGALGVMYADFFTKELGKEKVRILADRERVERYKKDQITFNGEICDFQYCDAARERRPSELMLFAVKYGALETAMEENAHLIGENTILLSVLNGIRSEEDLRRKFGREKVVHCIAQKMAAMKEGKSGGGQRPFRQDGFSLFLPGGYASCDVGDDSCGQCGRRGIVGEGYGRLDIRYRRAESGRGAVHASGQQGGQENEGGAFCRDDL